jgi:secreted trypsin-like serine protease
LAVIASATLSARPVHAQDRTTAEQRAAEIERRVNSAGGPRIVGGDNANPGDLPWQAGIVFRKSATRIWCGGSFIRPNIVMTAGHCVTAMLGNAKLFKVVSGSVNLDDPAMRSHDIVEVILHPRFTEIAPIGLDYDFALIRVAQAFSGRLIEIVTPAQNNSIGVGTPLQVSGWGRTLAGGVGTTRLQKLTVPVVSRNDCNDANSYNGIITSRMLCAGYQAGDRDSCNGDSGGPITVAVGNTRRLVGVVSFGDSCALRDKYGVYGRLHAVRGWINSSVALLSDQ